MREFSIVAGCSYSVHKYHRECAKTHFVVRNTTKIFWGRGPPVPLSDGLDTRPCKILDPPLNLDKHCPILIIFGRDIPQVYWLKMILFPPDLTFCFCTTCGGNYEV